MDSRTPRPSVLVADDDRAVADLFATYLEPACETTTVYGGQAALDALSAGHDVLLLDRRMPEVSGEAVAAEAEARGCEARVAMVTAVRPDFGVIDEPVDDYVVKPVGRDGLRRTVAELLLMGRLDDRLVALSAMRRIRRLLENEKCRPELVRSDAYTRLLEDIADVEDEIRGIEQRLDGPALRRN